MDLLGIFPAISLLSLVDFLSSQSAEKPYETLKMDNTDGWQQFLSPPVVEVNVVTVLVNLALAAALAGIMSVLYVKYGRSLSNRRLFARNFFLLACTTTLIITIVKSSLALSLGLVGALSIVRFRSAIKEPEELSYLFLTIAIGLGLGADQREITLAAFGLIGVFIVLVGMYCKDDAHENLMLRVATRDPNQTSLQSIAQALNDTCAAVSLRRFDERSEGLEACFTVEFDDYEQLENSRRELLSLDDSLDISFIDNRGIL